MDPRAKTIPAREVRKSDLITLAIATNGDGDSVYTYGEVIANVAKGTGYREIKTIAGTVLTVPTRFPVAKRVAATLCEPTGRKIEDEPDEEDEFGEVELTPFRPDPDTGETPVDVLRLDRFEDGALVEDAEGRLFNVVRQGPTQGSTEIVDDDEIHAYYDCGTLVRRHAPQEED